jgi:hypothetical protein
MTGAVSARTLGQTPPGWRRCDMNALWVIVLLVMLVPVLLAVAVALGPVALLIGFIAALAVPVLLVAWRGSSR